MLSFQEMAAWMAATGRVLSGWELSTLRSLSGAYLAEYDAASDPNRAPPYTAVEVESIDRKAIANARLEMFRRLAAQDASKGLGPKPDPSEAPATRRRSTPGSDGRGR